MFRGQRERAGNRRAALCDKSQRDAGAACWDRGLQKNLRCLRLCAMFNWNRTCPWKGIHRFGEIKCSIWTNGEMTTLHVVKCRVWSALHFPLFHSSLILSTPSLGCFCLQVHIRGFRWVSELRGTLDISSCRHICPPSWSPFYPGFPSGSIMTPLQLGWPWVSCIHTHCIWKTFKMPSPPEEPQWRSGNYSKLLFYLY